MVNILLASLLSIHLVIHCDPDGQPSAQEFKDEVFLSAHSTDSSPTEPVPVPEYSSEVDDSSVNLKTEKEESSRSCCDEFDFNTIVPGLALTFSSLFFLYLFVTEINSGRRRRRRAVDYLSSGDDNSLLEQNIQG